jgi:phosphopantothenoylcysteine decarboxylase/phosphopantothenate--cysteine ligase
MMNGRTNFPPYIFIVHRSSVGAKMSSPALHGREVIVAICGGIAAYKVAEVVSKLVQAGAGVSVVMTDSAQKFVTPLTFQALSGRPVRTSTWDLQDSSDPQHISLTEKSDLLLVAPATADMIAKVAHGLCDDLVSVMIAAAACPVVFAPAMNNRMWDNPIAQENVAKLKLHGYQFIGPEAGWLACRNVGAGRLTEAAEIVEQVCAMLIPVKLDQPATT